MQGEIGTCLWREIERVCVCLCVIERERENCAVLHRHLLNSQLHDWYAVIDFTAGKERIVKNHTKV